MYHYVPHSRCEHLMRLQISKLSRAAIGNNNFGRLANY